MFAAKTPLHNRINNARLFKALIALHFQMYCALCLLGRKVVVNNFSPPHRSEIFFNFPSFFLSFVYIKAETLVKLWYLRLNRFGRHCSFGFDFLLWATSQLNMVLKAKEVASDPLCDRCAQLHLSWNYPIHIIAQKTPGP